MNKNGFPGLHNYLDDLIYCGLPSDIHEPYQFLISLLQDLGLAISQKKLCPPSTQVVCLGILFDTKSSTMFCFFFVFCRNQHALYNKEKGVYSI